MEEQYLHGAIIEENQYVELLATVVNRIMNPLLASSAKVNFAGTHDDMCCIFLNIEDIFATHQMLLLKLKGISSNNEKSQLSETIAEFGEQMFVQQFKKKHCHIIFKQNHIKYRCQIYIHTQHMQNNLILQERH